MTTCRYSIRLKKSDLGWQNKQIFIRRRKEIRDAIPCYWNNYSLNSALIRIGLFLRGPQSKLVFSKFENRDETSTSSEQYSYTIKINQENVQFYQNLSKSRQPKLVFTNSYIDKDCLQHWLTSQPQFFFCLIFVCFFLEERERSAAQNYSSFKTICSSIKCNDMQQENYGRKKKKSMITTVLENLDFLQAIKPKLKDLQPSKIY